MNAGTFDGRRFKALERAGFNRIAERYAGGARLRTELAEAVIVAADLRPGHQVLDLASGPGLLAGPAAEAVGDTGVVIATDIAERMLTTARGTLGDGLLYAAADAEHLCLRDASVDRVLAGLALFMFPHPHVALTEIRRVLCPDGRLVLSVWGERASVPLISVAQDAIASVLPAPKVVRPSVFRMGTHEALTALLDQAGLGAERITRCDFDCCFDTADDYWQAFLDLAGGAAESLAQLPAARLAAVRDAVAELLIPYRHENGYTLGASALIASATPFP